MKNNPNPENKIEPQKKLNTIDFLGLGDFMKSGLLLCLINRLRKLFTFNSFFEVLLSF